MVLTQVLMTLAALLVGVLILAYCVWARRGGSELARFWMGTELSERWNDERMAVLGGPAIALLCFCFAGIAAPGVGDYLVWVAAPLAVPGFLLLAVALIPFIRLPDVLYPQWARDVRRRREATRRQMDEMMRRHRGR
ncbi:MAG TPA: hypothetical protein VK053_08830 [Jiangellaceae bacterium]|nr:hypothetical protein [Jiangellaceae bacterium]